jgi:hypothetical protein
MTPGERILTANEREYSQITAGKDQKRFVLIHVHSWLKFLFHYEARRL